MLSATRTISTQRATTAAITATCCGSSLASSGMTSFQRQQRRAKASAVPNHSQRHATTSAFGYNFASTGYNDCFRDLPKPNTDALRASAMAYLEKFDQKKWYDEPVSCPLLQCDCILVPVVV